MDRRQFLRLFPSIAIIPTYVLLPDVSPVASTFNPSHEVLFSALGRVLKSQGESWGAPFEEGMLANLAYALRAVEPRTLTEHALCVRMGMVPFETHSLIDEYCRRRSGKPQLSMDDSCYNLERWCVPETHGLIVFREQARALLKELIGCSDAVADTFLRAVWARRDRMLSHLRGELGRVTLAREGVDRGERVLELITQGHCGLQPHITFAFCSTVVERGIAELPRPWSIADAFSS